MLRFCDVYHSHKLKQQIIRLLLRDNYKQKNRKSFTQVETWVLPMSGELKLVESCLSVK